MVVTESASVIDDTHLFWAIIEVPATRNTVLSAFIQRGDNKICISGDVFRNYVFEMIY